MYGVDSTNREMNAHTKEDFNYSQIICFPPFSPVLI